MKRPKAAAWKKTDPMTRAFAGDDWQIMPCKDVGKAADAADLPKPTDTEISIVLYCKEPVCLVDHPAVLR